MLVPKALLSQAKLGRSMLLFVDTRALYTLTFVKRAPMGALLEMGPLLETNLIQFDDKSHNRHFFYLFY